MGLFTRLEDLFNRLNAYAAWEVLVELVIIWLMVYAILRFLRGTRAARAIQGLIFVLIVGTLIVRVLGDDTLARLAYLYDRVLAGFALALVVIFQPELRRALIRLGETRFFSSTEQGAAAISAQLAPACVFLSKARFGAIIVIERRVGLKALTEGGTDLDAKLSSSLIQTIFHPGSALHDLAVVIKGDRIHSAGVQLPMASATEITDQSFGSRHRAAIGVTKDSDAMVIVVSEESGKIRIAQRGKLSTPVKIKELESTLRDLLGHHDEEEQAEPIRDDQPDDLESGFVETPPPPVPSESDKAQADDKREGSS
ncbi:MAG: diadenylate cyclase CdaA [Phycisphaerales bacterium]